MSDAATSMRAGHAVAIKDEGREATGGPSVRKEQERTGVRGKVASTTTAAAAGDRKGRRRASDMKRRGKGVKQHKNMKWERGVQSSCRHVRQSVGFTSHHFHSS